MRVARPKMKNLPKKPKGVLTPAKAERYLQRVKEVERYNADKHKEFKRGEQALKRVEKAINGRRKY